jgi:ubiquinone/menaquinone biosynthesis C-methylase UbiE
MKFPEKSLEAYSLARSALFKTESFIGPAVELLVNRRLPKTILTDPELFRTARASMMSLMKQDVANISAGIYPPDVLKPGNPVKHLLRIPALFKEVFELSKRRHSKTAHRFSSEAQDLLTGLPEYYQRNFHFQDDGYLSDRSADLYEHQVEILFAGSADAMRRLIIAPLKEKFGLSHDGTGLTFLEVAAGTGRATRFVRLAFPRAKIVAVDLSAPYLRKAQAELSGFNRHDFVAANASDLPFKDETFDAAYSVFLFHELPEAERRAVFKECQRVLKPGGFHGLVDSVQLGDVPAFDEALELFPQNFHEPFYKNYIRHPIQDELARSGVDVRDVKTGFFSKCVWGEKTIAR